MAKIDSLVLGINQDVHPTNYCETSKKQDMHMPFTSRCIESLESLPLSSGLWCVLVGWCFNGKNWLARTTMVKIREQIKIYIWLASIGVNNGTNHLVGVGVKTWIWIWLACNTIPTNVNKSFNWSHCLMDFGEGTQTNKLLI